LSISVNVCIFLKPRKKKEENDNIKKTSKPNGLFIRLKGKANSLILMNMFT